MKKYDLMLNSNGSVKIRNFGYFEEIAALIGFGCNVDTEYVMYGNNDNVYRIAKSDTINNAHNESILKFIKRNNLIII